jgi:hypothetical protein
LLRFNLTLEETEVNKKWRSGRFALVAVGRTSKS